MTKWFVKTSKQNCSRFQPHHYLQRDPTLLHALPTGKTNFSLSIKFINIALIIIIISIITISSSIIWIKMSDVQSQHDNYTTLPNDRCLEWYIIAVTKVTILILWSSSSLSAIIIIFLTTQPQHHHHHLYQPDHPPLSSARTMWTKQHRRGRSWSPCLLCEGEALQYEDDDDDNDDNNNDVQCLRIMITSDGVHYQYWLGMITWPIIGI